MQVRTPILSALIAGPVVGVLMGLAADPTMIPSPEPTWRKMRPDPILADNRVFAESPPQDLSPTWWTDRLPTWKRRALEAEWRRFAYEPEPLPALDTEPAPEPELAPEFTVAEAESSESRDATDAARGLEATAALPAIAQPSEEAAETAGSPPQTAGVAAPSPQI